MKFRNPANSHVEEIDAPLLWTFLLGPFYLAFKGAWLWAATYLLTGPVAWIALPFFAEDILRKQYLRKGWTEEPEEDEPLPAKRMSAARRRKLDEAARRTFGA